MKEAWAIEIIDNEGNVYNSNDIPDYISQMIDEWLNSLGGEEE